MAGFKFFDRYYNGNPNQRDFTEDDLPTDRRALFHEVFKTRRGSLIGLNIVYLFFWIPAILWTFINLLQLTQLAAGAAEAITLDSLIFTYLLVLFPLVTITGPASAGLGYVLRNWARDEHAAPYSDGWAALKANWKQGLLLGFMNGLVPLVVYVCGRFYLGMVAESVFFYIPLVLTLIIALLWLLAAPLLPMMLVTYKLKFSGLVRNAIIMTLAELPRSFLLRLLTYALPLIFGLILLLIPSSIKLIMPLGLILYTLIVPALCRLIWASHANALCEKYMNPKIEGAEVNIGLNIKGDEVDNAK